MLGSLGRLGAMLALTPLRLGLLSLGLWLGLGVQAHETCRAFEQRTAHDWGAPAPCYCGPSLRRVSAHLPGTLRVVAACRMRWNQGARGDQPLRPDTDRLDLDRYDAHGNLPAGRVFLRGQVELAGVVRFTDDGVSFSALQLVKDEGATSVLANNHLYRGVFFTAQQEKQLKPPSPGPNAALCQTRTARLRFTDFDIKLIDTDEGGSQPRLVEVLQLGPLQACAEG